MTSKSSSWRQNGAGVDRSHIFRSYCVWVNTTITFGDMRENIGWCFFLLTLYSRILKCDFCIHAVLFVVVGKIFGQFCACLEELCEVFADVVGLEIQVCKYPLLRLLSLWLSLRVYMWAVEAERSDANDTPPPPTHKRGWQEFGQNQCNKWCINYIWPIFIK